MDVVQRMNKRLQRINQRQNCVKGWIEIEKNRSPIRMKLFRRAEEFHFNTEIADIEFVEMQEGDEIDLFWNAINERTHQRKYNSLLNGILICKDLF